MREIVESVVVAFVLAFLFRTFEAEAFVIPHGIDGPHVDGPAQGRDLPQVRLSLSGKRKR